MWTFKLYSPPPVCGEHPPDLRVSVQGAGVAGHEGGGGQAEGQLQGGHPVQGAAVRGAADSVPRPGTVTSTPITLITHRLGKAL